MPRGAGFLTIATAATATASFCSRRMGHAIATRRRRWSHRCGNWPRCRACRSRSTRTRIRVSTPCRRVASGSPSSMPGVLRAGSPAASSCACISWRWRRDTRAARWARQRVDAPRHIQYEPAPGAAAVPTPCADLESQTMKILGFQSNQGLRLGVVEGDNVIDLQAADARLPVNLADVLAETGGDLKPLADLAKKAPASARVPLKGLKFGLPVARPPKSICLGLNYLEHVKEGFNRDNIPKFPTIFMRCQTSLVPHGE